MVRGCHTHRRLRLFTLMDQDADSGLGTRTRMYKQKSNNRSGIGSPPPMDPYLVMLGSLTCTMTALIFVEVRRIRKKLEQRVSEPSVTKTAA